MAEVDLDAAQQKAGSLFLKRFCLPVPPSLGRLERGLALALQHEEIDQVLLGYLYSGAAFADQHWHPYWHAISCLWRHS
jgi:hypothetical protein